jgi:arabinan endo-1,5-alpha-L-arabinosidase
MQAARSPSRARSLPSSRLIPLIVALTLAALVAPAAQAASANYRNPLNVTADGQAVETCADPTVIRGQTAGDTNWYMYCTTDPLHSEDRDANGGFVFHKIPTFTSTDLVNWTYVGDAFSSNPSWAESTAGLWAPEIQFFNGQYYLYFGVTDVKPAVSGEPEDCHFDNAIGVATSPSPTGPWTDSGGPVIEPRRGGGGCNFFWTYDPDVITAPAADTVNAGQKFIYYGSYYGGVQVRELSADGLSTTPASAVQVTIPNRYEGSEVIYRNGFYYYFGSATNCCDGPVTGYSVFVGRSASPTGPFVDQEGVSLLASRVGGTVFLTMNGNRWIGLGHQHILRDFDGQWWTIYHAIDRNDPYFESAQGFTKRPAMLDPIDWIDGWPTVRGGAWASDKPMKKPAAQPGQESRYRTDSPVQHRIGKLLDGDEFNGTSLGSGWSWVREPSVGTSVSGGQFHFETQAADLYIDSDTASVLTRDLPDGNWLVETRVRLTVPPEGCPRDGCFNYRQAGLVVYDHDDAYLKLVHASIWETRQTEWAKEIPTAADNEHRYGNTVVGPPGDWTYMRIARWERGGEVHYQAYTSFDGQNWYRGGAWTHELDDPVIGLVSMGGNEFRADFDYLRVYRLRATGSYN